MDEEQIESLTSFCFDRLKQQSGRAIDDAFIKAGFVGVQAEIDLLAATLGRDSYESLLKLYSSEEYREEIILRSDSIRDAFNELESIDERKAFASKLIKEQGLPGSSKYSLLRRYAPDFLDELFLPYMPAYSEKLKEEARLICKQFPLPYENLHPATMTARRKHIFNAVAAEVFASLGFIAAKSERGLNSYIKPLGNRFSILFKTDCASLERDYSLTRYFPSRYWGGMQLDHHMSVMYRNGRTETAIMGFGMQDSVAGGRMRNYDGSCSLEIAIRGYGFWYELAVKPLEKVLLEAD